MVDLWTPKSIEVLLGSWTIHVKSIIIVRQKKVELSRRNHFSTNRRTDRQTDSYGESSIPPPPTHTHNFVAGGIMIQDTYLGFRWPNNILFDQSDVTMLKDFIVEIHSLWHIVISTGTKSMRGASTLESSSFQHLRPQFLFFSFNGRFWEKMESRGRNKNKNKTEKFVQSIHKI